MSPEAFGRLLKLDPPYRLLEVHVSLAVDQDQKQVASVSCRFGREADLNRCFSWLLRLVAVWLGKRGKFEMQFTDVSIFENKLSLRLFGV
jgi:hypothetical protein